MKRNAKSATNPLVGKWFHSLNDDCSIQWQGQVIGQIQEEGVATRYLVQLYEWLGGTPNVQRIAYLGNMEEWLFYNTAEEMKFSYEHGVAKAGGKYRPVKADHSPENLDDRRWKPDAKPIQKEGHQ